MASPSLYQPTKRRRAEVRFEPVPVPAATTPSPSPPPQPPPQPPPPPVPVVPDAWDDARYSPHWPGSGAAREGREMTLHEYGRPVALRRQLLTERVPARRAALLAELASLPLDDVMLGFHTVAQALVRGMRHDQTRIKAATAMLVDIEVEVARRRFQAERLSVTGVLQLPAEAVLRPSQCPQSFTAYFADRARETGSHGPIGRFFRVPFERALVAVGTRDCALGNGYAYVPAAYATTMALERVAELARGALAVLSTWGGVDHCLDMRVLATWRGVRAAYETATTARNAPSADPTTTVVTLDCALASAPRCVTSVWTHLEEKGHVRQEHRPLLVNFFRCAGVTQAELTDRWCALVARRGRGEHKTLGYMRDIAGLYRRKYNVPSCKTLLAIPGHAASGFACAGSPDIEDLKKCQKACAVACGRRRDPEYWSPMVAYGTKRRSTGAL